MPRRRAARRSPIGRLIAQKDHATLLRAFALVRDSLPEARLAILG